MRLDIDELFKKVRVGLTKKIRVFIWFDPLLQHFFAYVNNAHPNLDLHKIQPEAVESHIRVYQINITITTFSSLPPSIPWETTITTLIS